MDAVEPVELLDDYWFFQNPLVKKNRMVRSASDPYPSSSSPVENKGSSGNAPEQSRNKSCSDLVDKRKKSLQRTPSLPVSIGRGRRVEDKQGGEKEAARTRRLNRLTRQSSLCTPLVVPPRCAYRSALTSPAKPLMRSTSAMKNAKPLESPNNALKSPRELEIEEVQGFKDLGFDFSRLDLTPTVTSIIPGLQTKKPDDWDESKVKRPYLSEAWLTQTPTVLLPGCVMPDYVDISSGTDIKKQLKHWARAVATNVRQECSEHLHLIMT